MVSAYFTYHKAKVIQALRYHFISRREIKLMMIIVNLFALLSAGLFFFKKISPVAFLLSSALWFAMMLMFWFLLPLVIYKRASTFRDRFQVSMDDQGFTLRNERGSRTWQWSELSSWLETPHFYHLYFNPRSFFIIPKEAFAGDEVHEARKILAGNVKK